MDVDVRWSGSNEPAVMVTVVACLIFTSIVPTIRCKSTLVCICSHHAYIFPHLFSVCTIVSAT